MPNIIASLQINGYPLSPSESIPLLKSTQSGNGYDLFYSMQEYFKGRYILKELEMTKRYRDPVNYPNAPGVTWSSPIKTMKLWLTDSDVRDMNSKMKDPAYGLKVSFNLIVAMRASTAFDFHRCWTCDAKADLVDKMLMETFCCHECHSLRLSALPTSVATMPPPNEEDFWQGPYDVYVPRDINDVPARNGRDRRFQRGDETKSSGFADLSEDKWKSKYAYEKNGYWFFRV